MGGSNHAYICNFDQYCQWLHTELGPIYTFIHQEYLFPQTFASVITLCYMCQNIGENISLKF